MLVISKVLSKSVSNAFRYYNVDETTETEKFVVMFDKLFDCLNVCSITEHLAKHKPDVEPYHSISDARLKVFVILYTMYIRTVYFLFIVMYSCPVVEGRISRVSKHMEKGS